MIETFLDNVGCTNSNDTWCSAATETKRELNHPVSLNVNMRRTKKLSSCCMLSASELSAGYKLGAQRTDMALIGPAAATQYLQTKFPV